MRENFAFALTGTHHFATPNQDSDDGNLPATVELEITPAELDQAPLPTVAGDTPLDPISLQPTLVYERDDLNSGSMESLYTLKRLRI